MKKLLSLLVAVLLVVALAACKTQAPTTTAPSGGDTTTTAKQKTYNEVSSELYNLVLGEFYRTYQNAANAKSVSETYALEAIAEAKLYESGVFLPTTSRGGNYAIGRVAPKSVSPCMWGSDEYRYKNAIVADKLITNTDRAALQAIYATQTTGAAYRQAAKAYLTAHGYTVQNEYRVSYTADNKTWDILASSKQVDSEKLVNFVDGLIEYDQENVMIPALASRWEVSADGLTYKFYIRDAKWVDYEGNEVADVKASDWVSGLQHMTDAKAGLDWLIDGIVKNYGNYVKDQTYDFSQVGIKADDVENVLTITLEQPTSYFLTMLAYSCFEPLCTSYYESKGGKFGKDFKADDESYLYGKSYQDIVYCGAFLCNEYAANSKYTMVKNVKYWDAANVDIEKVVWLYNDGKDELKAYNDCIAGTLSGAGLNTAAVAKAKEDGNFADYHYVSETNATAFCGFWNINRAQFANAHDDTKLKSTKTEAQIASAKEALLNADFRLAVAFAIDRGAYNAASVGDELKYNRLTNGYTPGNFVKLDETVTVKINGTDKTYPAGTYYGQIVQDQLDADNCPIKYWDATKLVSSGFDGWYNVTNAKAYLAKAIAAGINATAENPIVLDYPCDVSPAAIASANAVKQSVEAALEGKVKINVIQAESADDFDDCGYNTEYGYEANYDLYTGSGWGPDYGDPKSYLDTMLPDGAGYMVKTLGIF